MSLLLTLPKRAKHWTLAWAALALTLIAYAALALSGVPTAIDQSLQSNIVSVNKRPASGDVAVLELDAKSLQAVGQWPWRREVHAQLIDTLSAHGADQIAFDIDFSARSNAQSDAALAKAINGSDSAIILATFKQLSEDGGARYTENLPLPELTDNAMLASVNVTPNDVGQISEYSYGEVTAGVVRPSLAALITGASGDLGESFTIDQAVDPTTIPRLSAYDVLIGAVEPQAIAGKTIIIGATAIELGDRYATPSHGVIPGVVIHAMAAETLSHGMDMGVVDKGIPFALAVLLILALHRVRREKKGGRRIVRFVHAMVILLLIIAKYTAYITGFATMNIGPAVVLIVVYLTFDAILTTLQTLRRERSTDAQSALPNAQAMVLAAPKHGLARVAVAQIGNFADVIAVSSTEELVAIIQSVAQRLNMLAYDGRVYRTGTDQIAWYVDDAYMSRLQDHFDTAAAFMLHPVEGTGEHALKLQVHCGYVEGTSDTVIELLAKASIAAHNAAMHGYRWVPYSEDINVIAREKLTILSDIDDAITQDQIWVAYQPKQCLATGEVNSAEALVRWNHPQLGAIRPDRFIPVLEADGRMVDLTLHILRKCLSDLEMWNSMGRAINCSINISAALLRDTDFIAQCLSLVHESTAHNEQVTFEITETASLEDLEQAAAITREIHAAGIRISIDDYGTGQSSLSYLRNFSAQEIKIDQSFIKSMRQNDVDLVMVGSTINLAHDMDLKVVAEGIEDAETYALLADFGCDVAQGWHIGRPVDAASFTQQWISAKTVNARVA